MNFSADKEYRVTVDGVDHGMDRIRSGNISRTLYDAPEVSGTCCAMLTMSFWPETPPSRAAEVRPYVRASTGAWQPLGIFWIDRRTEAEGRLDIVAYDAMMRAEALWTPGDGLAFPMTMEEAARAIAAAMGTELDSRCAFNGSYTVDHPMGAYTMREVLGHIASAHVGNWQVTAEGRLLLTPLYGSVPPETSNLVTEDGDAILFGGVRIRI